MNLEHPRISDRYRKFAELVVQGIPSGRAYERSGFRARGASADTEASKTLRKPQVLSHIALLREEAAKVAAFSRNDAIAMLSSILLAKPSDATMDNPLCDSKVIGGVSVPVFPDKLRCLERLTRMLGWDTGEEAPRGTVTVVIGGDEHVPSLMKRIRERTSEGFSSP